MKLRQDTHLKNKKTWNEIFSKYLNSKEGSIRVAIIGGGIYGCHMSNELANSGANITLYEKEKLLFSGASSWGDTRIHNGVKYLRNKKTRDLLITEQIRFIKKYPHFLTSYQEHEHEIQMIAEDSQSILDLGSFIDLYDKTENGKLTQYKDYPTIEYPINSTLNNKHNWSKIMTKMEIEQIFKFKNIEGGILHGLDVCPKMYVDFPRDWFYSEFSRKNNISLKLDTTVVLNKNEHSSIENIVKLNIIENKNKTRFNFRIANRFFDYVINCTYNQSFPFTTLNQNKKEELPFYEVGFSLVFAEKNIQKDKKKFKPFSIYDGPFPGMTPFNIKNFNKSIFSDFKNKKLYTTTSGRLGESFKIYNIEDANKIKEQGNSKSNQRFTKNKFYTLKDEEENDVKNVLESILHYYPDLMNDFDVIYKYWWIKSLYPSASTARPIMIQSNQNIHSNFLSVFSSKLSTVMKAEDLLLEKFIELEEL